MLSENGGTPFYRTV